MRIFIFKLYQIVMQSYSFGKYGFHPSMVGYLTQGIGSNYPIEENNPKDGLVNMIPEDIFKIRGGD